MPGLATNLKDVAATVKDAAGGARRLNEELSTARLNADELRGFLNQDDPLGFLTPGPAPLPTPQESFASQLRRNG